MREGWPSWWPVHWGSCSGETISPSRMTALFFTDQTPVTDDVLNVIAHLPTRSLTSVAAPGFFQKMTDADFMRLAVLLAQKSYEEGGCPIGGVIISNDTRQILGKGHNTLVQENHPYNHAETEAGNDHSEIKILDGFL